MDICWECCRGVADYVVRSNRETGCGRADIQIVSFDLNKPAFILELKKSGRLPTDGCTVPKSVKAD